MIHQVCRDVHHAILIPLNYESSDFKMNGLSRLEQMRQLGRCLNYMVYYTQESLGI